MYKTLMKKYDVHILQETILLTAGHVSKVRYDCSTIGMVRLLYQHIANSTFVGKVKL